jgi:hypothetical protein
MESKGSGKRPANQLQGSAVQDQTVQSRAATKAARSKPSAQGITPAASGPDSPQPEKVVIQFGSRTIKGYLDTMAGNSVEELLSNASHKPPEAFRLRSLETNSIKEIPAKDIKAVFYVNSFEGNADHQHLNFHSRAPVIHGIWMRLQFLDGEVMEGIVNNSLRYLVDPGFFLLPTDPDSNNRLVYVRKSWLADHRILGMRKLHVPAAPSSD